MKKLHFIFLFLFSLTLVACGSVDSAEQGEASDLSSEIVSANQNQGAKDDSQDTASPNQDADVAQLPAGMVSLNYSRLSLNYAKISWSASYVQSAFLRVPINYSQNYLDVKLPVSEKNRSGSVKVELSGKKSVFTMYYRDWANRLNKKQIQVSRGG